MWCRVIIDAETSLMSYHAQRRNSKELCQAQCVGMGAPLESQESSGEGQRASVDGSQAGRVHRLSRESSGAHPLPLSCRESLDNPSLCLKASTTITDGLLPSVTESDTPLLPEQEVPTLVSRALT